MGARQGPTHSLPRGLCQAPRPVGPHRAHDICNFERSVVWNCHDTCRRSHYKHHRCSLNRYNSHNGTDHRYNWHQHHRNYGRNRGAHVDFDDYGPYHSVIANRNFADTHDKYRTSTFAEFPISILASIVWKNSKTRVHKTGLQLLSLR